MSHPSQDELLSLSLELLDWPEAEAARQHLAGCPPCQAAYGELLAIQEAVRGFHVPVPPRRMDLPAAPRRRRLHLWRAAAVLALGVTGYGALALLEPPPLVVAQRLHVAVPPDSLQPRVACEPVDLVAGD